MSDYMERREAELKDRYELIRAYLAQGKAVSVQDMRFARLYEFTHGKKKEADNAVSR